MKNALATDKIPRAQAALVDNFKVGDQVTAQDVSRAVTHAKEHLIAKYDLDENGLSKDELKRMSLTGRNAMGLSKALQEAASAE